VWVLSDDMYEHLALPCRSLQQSFFAKGAAILAFSTATLAKPWKECYSCVKLEAFHGRLGAK
jgi:hypothetical protein